MDLVSCCLLKDKIRDIELVKTLVYTGEYNSRALNNVKKQGILGYIIGEYMILDDGRKAYYISYIYVIKPYRHKKIGSKLLDFAIQHSKYNNILLTFDTKNPVLMKFYTSKGFQPDWVHRSFDDIQVYCLIR